MQRVLKWYEARMDKVYKGEREDLELRKCAKHERRNRVLRKLPIKWTVIEFHGMNISLLAKFNLYILLHTHYLPWAHL